MQKDCATVDGTGWYRITSSNYEWALQMDLAWGAVMACAGPVLTCKNNRKKTC